MKNILAIVSVCITLLVSGCSTSQCTKCSATCQPPADQTARYYNTANTNDVITLGTRSSADGFTWMLGDTVVVGNTTYKKISPEQPK